jgi:hypothetical protein
MPGSRPHGSIILSRGIDHVTAFLDVLRIIHRDLEGSSARWALTGSLGMALQGMPIEPHDIDMQTDPEGAYEIERRLARWMVRPVTFSEAEGIRSHFGEARIRGTKVEIMGGIQKRLPDGSWEDPVPVTRHRRIVDVNGMAIPVLSLEYEYEAYTRLERHDRAEQIRRFISEKQ